MADLTKTEEEKQITELSQRVLKIARDSIIVHLRFLDVALTKLSSSQRKGLLKPMCDGAVIYYDERNLLKKCRQERAYAIRMYLHCLFHNIFAHPFVYRKLEDDMHKHYFSLAADIAIEATIMELGLSDAKLSDDAARMEKLRALRKNASKITATNLYRYFLANEPSEEGEAELIRLFVLDDHSCWNREEMTISLAQWQKLSERIKADIRTFSKEQNHSEGLSENLEEATRQRYDYSDILRRFCVMGEDIKVNDEEFDYIYYTYGLSHYKNMPLVEPLEYQDVKKIREFVIVLDTSASCQGKVVKKFLEKTYSILKNQESFFSKMNVHIVQCDNSVQSDVRISSDEDFDTFLQNGKLTGFGGTDFRPAFTHVLNLMEQGEFENLKGLIYFTDGYGIYPESMPPFDSMFVFPDEDANRMEVPPWAIKVVLEEE